MSDMTFELTKTSTVVSLTASVTSAPARFFANTAISARAIGGQSSSTNSTVSTVVTHKQLSPSTSTTVSSEVTCGPIVSSIPTVSSMVTHGPTNSFTRRVLPAGTNGPVISSNSTTLSSMVTHRSTRTVLPADTADTRGPVRSSTSTTSSSTVMHGPSVSSTSTTAFNVTTSGLTSSTTSKSASNVVTRGPASSSTSTTPSNVVTHGLVSHSTNTTASTAVTRGLTSSSSSKSISIAATCGTTINQSIDATCGPTSSSIITTVSNVDTRRPVSSPTSTTASAVVTHEPTSSSTSIKASAAVTRGRTGSTATASSAAAHGPVRLSTSTTASTAVTLGPSSSTNTTTSAAVTRGPASSNSTVSAAVTRGPASSSTSTSASNVVTHEAVSSSTSTTASTAVTRGLTSSYTSKSASTTVTHGPAHPSTTTILTTVTHALVSSSMSKTTSTGVTHGPKTSSTTTSAGVTREPKSSTIASTGVTRKTSSTTAASTGVTRETSSITTPSTGVTRKTSSTTAASTGVTCETSSTTTASTGVTRETSSTTAASTGVTHGPSSTTITTASTGVTHGLTYSTTSTTSLAVVTCGSASSSVITTSSSGLPWGAAAVFLKADVVLKDLDLKPAIQLSDNNSCDQNKDDAGCSTKTSLGKTEGSDKQTGQGLPGTHFNKTVIFVKAGETIPSSSTTLQTNAAIRKGKKKKSGSRKKVSLKPQPQVVTFERTPEAKPILTKEEYLAANLHEKDPKLQKIRMLAYEVIALKTDRPNAKDKMHSAANRVPIRVEFSTEPVIEGKNNSSFICTVFVDGASVASGQGLKIKDAKTNAYEAALQKILMPHIRIVQLDPDSFQIEGSKEPFSSPPPEPSKVPIVKTTAKLPPIAAKTAETISTPKEIATLHKESNLETACLKRRFNEVKPVEDFVIVEPEIANQDCTPAHTLRRSADFNHMLLEYEYFFRGEAARCVLKIENQVLADVNGASKVASKNLAAAQALAKLKTMCWVIKTKKTADTNVRVSKEDMLNEFIELNEQSISYDNIGNQLLRKMGWSGGGMGKNGRGIVEPVTLTSVLNREGLGLSTKKGITEEFKQRVREIIEIYASSNNQEDVVFDYDFRLDERQVIHNECRRLNLRSKCCGKGRKRYLCVQRKRSANELFDHIMSCGGETPKYILVPPGSEAAKEIKPETSSAESKSAETDKNTESKVGKGENVKKSVVDGAHTQADTSENSCGDGLLPTPIGCGLLGKAPLTDRKGITSGKVQAFRGMKTAGSVRGKKVGRQKRKNIFNILRGIPEGEEDEEMESSARKKRNLGDGQFLWGMQQDCYDIGMQMNDFGGINQGMRAGRFGMGLWEMGDHGEGMGISGQRVRIGNFGQGVRMDFDGQGIRMGISGQEVRMRNYGQGMRMGFNGQEMRMGIVGRGMRTSFYGQEMRMVNGGQGLRKGNVGQGNRMNNGLKRTEMGNIDTWSRKYQNDVSKGNYQQDSNKWSEQDANTWDSNDTNNWQGNDSNCWWGNDANNWQGTDANNWQSNDVNNWQGNDSNNWWGNDANSWQEKDNSWQGNDAKAWQGNDAKAWQGNDAKAWQGNDAKTWQDNDTNTWQGYDANTWQGKYTNSWQGNDANTWKGIDSNSWQDSKNISTWQGNDTTTWHGNAANT